MNKIIYKKELASKIKLIKIFSPEMVEVAKPGQFVILRLNKRGERFPLTITGCNPTEKTIEVVYKEVGKSTIQLGKMDVGNEIQDFIGPLGNPSKIDKFGNVLCVGGEVMIAPLYFVAKALKAAGNNIISVIGARNKDLLIFQNEIQLISNEFYIITDDGSVGYKNFNFLKNLLVNKNINYVICMGSIVTMKTVSEITKDLKIKTRVTLTPIMVDGTGMCGCCRVSIAGETKYACIDGPEFNGHQVDWDMLTSRIRIYLPHEKVSAIIDEKIKQLK